MIMKSEVNNINIVSCCIQVKSGISSKFSGISGYKYEVCKFKIIESKDIKYGTPVRDYFLKVNQIICMKHLYILYFSMIVNMQGSYTLIIQRLFYTLIYYIIIHICVGQ